MADKKRHKNFILGSPFNGACVSFLTHEGIKVNVVSELDLKREFLRNCKHFIDLTFMKYLFLCKKDGHFG